MLRPKTYTPANGKGGGRQAMWDLLRRGGQRSYGDLMTASGSAYTSVASYMDALITHGYVARPDPGVFELVKNTGKRAPSVNSAKKTLYDWNLNPPMKSAKLRSIWEKSGLPLNAFGKAIGMPESQGTRLKQMIDGTREISPAVEAAALVFRPAKK